jgi:beta-lactamase regulating signal transducer with metallopeptidase domain
MTWPLSETPGLLGWSAAAMLGQGVLVLAAYLPARRTLRASSAGARYRLALAAFLILALLPPLSLLAAQLALHARLAAASPAAAPAWPSAAVAERVGVAFPWLFAVWLLGATIGLLRLAAGAWRLKRQIASANAARSELLPSPSILSRAGLRFAPRVLESAAVAGPFVAGWGTGVLVLPTEFAAALTAPERDVVVLHELMHLRRRDFIVNVVQRVLESLLWFQPAIWFIGADLTRIREECCDEAVIRAAGRPAILARALVRLEELRGGAASLAMAGTGGALTARINRLLVSPPDGSSHPALWISGLALMLSAGGAGLGAGSGWVAAVTSRTVPVVTIAAEDPAGRFTLEMAGGIVRAVTIAGAPVPRARLVQSGRMLHLLDERGRPQLEIEIRSPAGIRWPPRSPGSP